MKLIDVQHPFFIPVWRRVALVSVCLGWAIYEFSTGAPFWGFLFGAAGLYCGWQFFAVFNPKPDQLEDKDV